MKARVMNAAIENGKTRQHRALNGGGQRDILFILPVAVVHSSCPRNEA